MTIGFGSMVTGITTAMRFKIAGKRLDDMVDILASCAEFIGTRHRLFSHQRATTFALIAPNAAKPAMAIEYHVATNSGESSVHCAA